MNLSSYQVFCPRRKCWYFIKICLCSQSFLGSLFSGLRFEFSFSVAALKSCPSYTHLSPRRSPHPLPLFSPLWSCCCTFSHTMLSSPCKGGFCPIGTALYSVMSAAPALGHNYCLNLGHHSCNVHSLSCTLTGSPGL